METPFQSGFVSIIGKPNAGKSTLMNRLMNEKMSIISPKAQTTRHRIMGILNADNYQIVYSDTPGILEPKYALHEAMMRYVKVSLEDADVILLMVTCQEPYDETSYARFANFHTPILLLLNKADESKPQEIAKAIDLWKEKLPNAKEIIPISALNGTGIDKILPAILSFIPSHPPYFDTEEFTDRTERFFAAEILREKIFLNYEQEIPYSCEINIESFKDDGEMIRISAMIYVERDSQKGILIGKAGASLKKTATEARLDMAKFFNRKIFLETRVKVAENWRKEKNKLRLFGYIDKD